MNTDLLSKVLIFTTGAAIGSIVTWKFMKTKYEAVEYGEEYEEEYEEEPEANDSQDSPEEPKANSDKVRYHKILDNAGYDYSEETTNKEEDDVEKPYVISPDDFSEIDGYQVVTLYLYADGVLTDDENNIIDDVDEIVGDDSLDTFGQYEDDCVYVRNDRLKSDYEILRVLDRYEDVN